MPLVSDRFGPYPLKIVLDGSGNGTVQFQATGKNIRITNLYVSVDTQVEQATCVIYKGQIGPAWAINGTNSGSTGAPATGSITLLDGESLFVVWSGGDPGATATATVSGVAIPFEETIGAIDSFIWMDPIAAGDGSLIYPAIKSPDFVAGSSGWAVFRDGSAEFNDVVVRGTFVANNGLVTIDNDGLHVIGTTARVDIDRTTAITVSPIPATGGFVNIDSALGYGGVIFLQPDDSAIPGVTWGNPGIVYTDEVLEGGGTIPVLKMLSPCVDGTPDLISSQITLRGQNSASASDDSMIWLEGSRVFADGHAQIDRWIAGHGAISNSAAIGTTETVVLTAVDKNGNTPTFKAFRAYKVVLTGGFLTATGANDALFRVRKTNAAGQQLAVARFSSRAGATTYDCTFTCWFIVGVSDVTASIVITLTGSAASTATLTGASTSPTLVNIYDDGPNAHYGAAATLV